MLNLSAKCLCFPFEFAGGQNTKIQLKYQNSFHAQNAKISAVSTPILTAKAAFFSIFQALSEKSVQNDWKPQKTWENFAPKFGKFGKSWKFLTHFGILSVFWNFGILLVFCRFIWKIEQLGAVQRSPAGVPAARAADRDRAHGHDPGADPRGEDGDPPDGRLVAKMSLTPS